jgi:hypothetical protein
MSIIKKSGAAVKRTSSGDHPIIKSVQAGLASIRENQLTQAHELEARADKLRENSNPPTDEEKQGRKSQPDLDEEGDTLPGIQVSVPESSTATTLPAPSDEKQDKP